jgi:hypothetical protein
MNTERVLIVVCKELPCHDIIHFLTQNEIISNDLYYSSARLFQQKRQISLSTIETALSVAACVIVQDHIDLLKNNQKQLVDLHIKYKSLLTVYMGDCKVSSTLNSLSL